MGDQIRGWVVVGPRGPIVSTFRLTWERMLIAYRPYSQRDGFVVRSATLGVDQTVYAKPSTQANPNA